MQKALSFLVIATFATPLAFAATGVDISSDSSVQMNAPTTTTSSVSLGEAKSVSCTSNPAFATNSCDACFDGGSVTVGKRLTGLFDNWTNNSTSIMVAYQNEQKNPNMISFGASNWTASPIDESKMWKNGSDVVWTPTQSGSTKMQSILVPGQKIRFVESDLAAGYTLTKTDRKNGELVGMMKYPLVAHVVDASGNEGVAKIHNECFVYNLSAPVVNPSKPVTPEITKTQTGPTETIVLILAAFFVAFGLMFSLRKRI